MTFKIRKYNVNRVYEIIQTQNTWHEFLVILKLDAIYIHKYPNKFW